MQPQEQEQTKEDSPESEVEEIVVVEKDTKL